MIKVYKLTPQNTCPRITVIDTSAGMPTDWVRGIDVPPWCASPSAAYRTLEATIDRSAGPREFCLLVPGALVISEDAFEDETGVTNIYYALWWEQLRIDLRAGGKNYACIIPKLTLQRDPDSSAPCAIGGVQASIFRIGGHDPTDIFCTSGIQSGGDEFPQLYEEAGCTGLDFELIWQGERSQS